MNSRKSTKHALYLSFISMILCMTMLLGTTFAWFTDEVTSTNNIIKSGTLDATMEYSVDGTNWNDASKGPIFNYKLWEPGYSDMKYVKIANVGDLAFKYQLNIAPNTPRNNEGLSLADVIEVYYDVVDADFEAPTASDKFGSLEKVGTLTQLMAETDGATHGVLYANTALTSCIVLHMQESAGNEYQGIWVGQSDEAKGFAVQLLASQYTHENDSFNNLFDEKAPTPVAGSASVKVTDGAIDVVVPNTNGEFVTLGYASFPEASIADDAEYVTLKIEKVALNGNVTVKADQSADTYEVTAIGIKENNTAEIIVRIYVGTGLTGVNLYHNEELVTNASYDDKLGYISFKTTSFSPFTVVYDKEAQEEEPTEETIPTAIVTTKNVDEIDFNWSTAGGFNTKYEEQELECVYEFAAPHDSTTVENSKYKDWYCDYYVMMDRDVAKESVCLGGNYGSFGWVGFNNPEPVAANTEVPLLGSVIKNDWTYDSVVSLVEKFLCGVAHCDESLNGATFTVMLRLTNPENPNEYYNVNTVKYTFDNTPSIGNGTARW